MFTRTEDGRLVYVGGRYVPKFETVTEGFTSLKMITRNDGSPTASSSNKTPTHPYLWDNATLIQSEGSFGNCRFDKLEIDGWIDKNLLSAGSIFLGLDRTDGNAQYNTLNHNKK